jgi:hypothetical protein
VCRSLRSLWGFVPLKDWSVSAEEYCSPGIETAR